jgi:predicted LPLAT superfamily acyltransferase
VLVEEHLVNWRSVPEAGTVLGLRIIAGALRLFGRGFTAFLLWFICWYYLAFNRTARAASRELFTRLGQPASWHRMHAHLWQFARVATDRLLFLTGRTESLVIRRTGHEHVMALKEKRRGAMLVGAHLGSFEAMRTLAGQYDVPLTVIADFRNARKVNALLQHFAPGLRVRLLELDPGDPTGVLAAKDAIDRGELVAILADRAIQREGRDVAVPFLGRDADFPVGPWVLASLLDCPVFFVTALFEAPRTYDVHCVPLGERIELPRKERKAALAREVSRYAQVLEEYVRRSPLNWFNFFPFWKDS